MLFPQSEHRDYVCVRLYRQLKGRIPSAKTEPFRAASLGIANAFTQVTLRISHRQMLLLQMPNVPIGIATSRKCCQDKLDVSPKENSFKDVGQTLLPCVEVYLYRVCDHRSQRLNGVIARRHRLSDCDDFGCGHPKASVSGRASFPMILACDHPKALLSNRWRSSDCAEALAVVGDNGVTVKSYNHFVIMAIKKRPVCDLFFTVPIIKYYYLLCCNSSINRCQFLYS